MRQPSLLPLVALWLTGTWACGREPLAPRSGDAPPAPVFSAHAPAADLIVDDDGVECPEAGFTSIGAAVAAAAPGDRIVVCEGTYHEQVTVSKNDLTILADEESGEVVVNAHGHDFGFRVTNASGVTIEGFRVEQGHEADIALNGATFTTIRQNITTAAGHDGIQLVNADDNIIVDNLAIDNLAANACGINIAGGSERNVVRDNRLVNNEWGIQIIGAATAKNVITENAAVENRGNGIRNVGGAPGTLIEENRAFDNGFAPSAFTGATASGIRIMSGTGIVVRENRVFGNSTVDLRSEAAATATFEENRCATSSPPGLCQEPGGS